MLVFILIQSEVDFRGMIRPDYGLTIWIVYDSANSLIGLFAQLTTIFGTSKEYGFAVIRVLGDNMDVSKIMELGPVINKLDTQDINVEGFLDFML